MDDRSTFQIYIEYINILYFKADRDIIYIFYHVYYLYIFLRIPTPIVSYSVFNRIPEFVFAPVRRGGTFSNNCHTPSNFWRPCATTVEKNERGIREGTTL